MTLPDTISDYPLSIGNLQFFNEPPPEDLLFETLFLKAASRILQPIKPNQVFFNHVRNG